MANDKAPEEQPDLDRRYRRVAIRTHVRISTIDPETDASTGRPYFRTSEETCANVSRGGAYVETEDAVSPGRRVLLEIDLPEGNRLQAVGRVAWTKTALQRTDRKEGPGMGIEFVAASDEELGRLERFLDAVNAASAAAAPKTTQHADDSSPETLPPAITPPLV